MTSPAWAGWSTRRAAAPPSAAAPAARAIPASRRRRPGSMARPARCPPGRAATAREARTAASAATAPAARAQGGPGPRGSSQAAPRLATRATPPSTRGVTRRRANPSANAPATHMAATTCRAWWPRRSISAVASPPGAWRTSQPTRRRNASTSALGGQQRADHPGGAVVLAEVRQRLAGDLDGDGDRLPRRHVLVELLGRHGDVVQHPAAVVDHQRDRARLDAGLAGRGEEGVPGLDLQPRPGRRGGAVVVDAPAQTGPGRAPARRAARGRAGRGGLGLAVPIAAAPAGADCQRQRRHGEQPSAGPWAHPIFTSTLLSTAGCRGAWALSTSRAMRVWVSPGLSPAVVAWKTRWQLMPSMVPMPIIGPVLESMFRCQWP